MFDFSITTITPAGNLYCGLLFFSIIFIYWNRCVVGGPIKFSHANGAFPLFCLIALFAITAWYVGDFFGYQRNVQSYYQGIQSFHLEKIYEYIIELTHQNYVLFRVVVWGGALICYTRIVSNYRVNTTMALFVLSILFITPFSYARATLAMAVYFLGVSYLSRWQDCRKIIYVLLGVSLVLGSYLFHKSMLVILLLTILYVVPINKKTVVPIFLIVSIFGYAIDFMMNSFQQMLLDIGDAQLVEKITDRNYSLDNRESVSASLFGWIYIIYEYVSFYLTFILVSIIFFKNKTIPPQIAGLYRIAFGIVIMATAILLFSSGSSIFFYRYLFMSFIPLSIITVYLLTNGYMPNKYYKMIIYMGGGYNILMFGGYIL